MADVFISYSRKDQPFVRRLYQVLTEDRCGVWVDWEGIPITADWWQEIRAGIEAADNFLFMTSPSSLESPICHLELAHATHCNKRIIPIIIADPDEKAAFGALASRDVDDNTLARLEGRDILMVARDNWRVISRHNWIDFRDRTAFEQQTKALIMPIGTDLDHVRQHTRLFVRADEWANNERAPDFVMRGEDLADAQAWLERGKGKEPTPTPLHLEFVQASATEQARLRVEEVRRVRQLRTTTRIAGVVGVIAIVIAVSAGVFTTTQVTNANSTLTPIAQRVQEGQNLSYSLQMAAAASTVLQANADPRLAVLLSIRELKSAYSRQADAALVWALAMNQRVRVLSGHTGGVLSVAWSPDGKSVLTGSGGNDTTARLWDVARGNQLRTFNGHTSVVVSVAWSPDGKSVLTGSADTTARLWDVARGKELHTLRGHTDEVESVAWSPDGKTALTGSLDRTARLWDVASGKELRTLSGHMGWVSSVAFAPDGKTILTGSLDNTARLWDTDYRDFMAFACTRIFRDFTDAERQQFAITDNEPTCPQFSTTGQSMTTPLPSTTTPLFNLTLPAWTPIASPTITSTFTPSVTPTPTATPTYPGVLLTFTSTPTSQ